MRRMLVPTLAVALAALAVVGCAPEPRPPSGDPSIRGEITSLDPTDEGASMLVESSGEPVFEVDKAQVTLDEASVLLRVTKDGYESANISDLDEGDVVDVWFEGPVAESYPVQAYGGTVVVR